jgi:hypothetical protein
LGDQEEYQDAQESQDNDEISQLAIDLEKQTWISNPSLAPQSLGVDLDNSVSANLDKSMPMNLDKSVPVHLDETVPMHLDGLVPADIDDSVATQLAEQLYSFHGCTDSAHDIQDDEYTQFQDLYTSLADISSFQAPSNSILGVLGTLDFIESQDLRQDLDPILIQQLYEGQQTSSAKPREESNPPKKLHLPHKPLEHQNQRSKITYDIDGLCLFPTSIGVA